MLIVGEKEVENNQVAVRRQGEGDKGAMTVDDFISHIKDIMHKELIPERLKELQQLRIKGETN